jgi:hypothetical protein
MTSTVYVRDVDQPVIPLHFVHQGRNKGIFVIGRMFWSRGGFHGLDRLLRSRIWVCCLFGAVLQEMTCFMAVETSAPFHVVLPFAVGHALAGEVRLGLSSVNIHQDIFIIGLLGGCSSGG